jgi:transposase
MSSRSCSGRGSKAHLAEPADTAAARGRKKHAKTDKTDARLQRDLLAQGRLPECWIPPAHVLECRALLELYHDLRGEHTAWVQRVHAVLFHQGAPAFGDLSRAEAPAQLAELARCRLSPAGQVQIASYLRMLDGLEAELAAVRRRLAAAARHLRGARTLTESIYGAGPVTALALTCWLGGAGRFSSSRKAVRFCGLDITVRSSDSKRPPGYLSRQGPPVLRWAVYEAGKTHARSAAPDHSYYAAVKDRRGGPAPRSPRPARSSGRPATSWPSSATTRSARCDRRCGGERARRTDRDGRHHQPIRHAPRPAPASPLSGRLRPRRAGTRRTAPKD